MNTKVITACAVALCAAASLFADAAKTAPAKTLKLMSYNIHNGWGKNGEKWNIGGPIHVIRENAPDVCAMQEVSWGGKASGFQIDMPTIMGHILAPLWRTAKAEARVTKDGVTFGNCILYKIESVGKDVSMKLPGKEQERAFVAVELPQCWVATVHLSRYEEFRVKSMPILAEFAKGKDKPVIVMGDFNGHPKSKALQEFKKTFKVISDESVLTCPTVKPDETIDYIAVDLAHADKVRVLSFAALDNPQVVEASDHRPLLMTVAFQ